VLGSKERLGRIVLQGVQGPIKSSGRFLRFNHAQLGLV